VCICVRLQDEVRILQRVDHQNVIKIEAVFDTAKYLYIILELCVHFHSVLHARFRDQPLTRGIVVGCVSVCAV
jgi:hypothetical protein